MGALSSICLNLLVRIICLGHISDRKTEPWQDEPGEGLYTEGCFALVEGEYTEDGTLEVVAMGQPPCEDRETARFVFLYYEVSWLCRWPTSDQYTVTSTSSVRVLLHYWKMYVIDAAYLVAF